MKTTKSKLEIILNTDAVQEFYDSHPELQKKLGQILLELGDGLLHATTPLIGATVENGFVIRIDEHILGTMIFSPAGTEIADQEEIEEAADGIKTPKEMH